MPEENRKPEPNEIDPVALEKLLEIELMQKRAGWQTAKARRNGWRALSFLFLFAVIVAALLAFYLFFSRGLDEVKSIGAQSVSPSPSAGAAER